MEAAIEDPPILIAFNIHFLREALGAIRTSNVTPENTVETGPGMLKPIRDTDITHILMPMHLGSQPLLTTETINGIKGYQSRTSKYYTFEYNTLKYNTRNVTRKTP